MILSLGPKDLADVELLKQAVGDAIGTGPRPWHQQTNKYLQVLVKNNTRIIPSFLVPIPRGSRSIP